MTKRNLKVLSILQGFKTYAILPLPDKRGSGDGVSEA